MKWLIKVWAFLVALAALLMCVQDFYQAEEEPIELEQYE